MISNSERAQLRVAEQHQIEHLRRGDLRIVWKAVVLSRLALRQAGFASDGVRHCVLRFLTENSRARERHAEPTAGSSGPTPMLSGFAPLQTERTHRPPGTLCECACRPR